MQGVRLQAQQLISDGRVGALIGTSTPGTSAALATVAQQAGVPLVMPSTGDLPTASYAFRSAMTETVTSTRLLDALRKAGLRRVAMLCTATEFDTTANWAEFSKLMAGYGLELTGHQEFKPPAGDLTDPLRELLATSPDVLTILATPPYDAYGADAVTLLHQAFDGHRDKARAREALESAVFVGAVGVSAMTPTNHRPVTTRSAASGVAMGRGGPGTSGHDRPIGRPEFPMVSYTSRLACGGEATIDLPGRTCARRPWRSTRSSDPVAVHKEKAR